MSSLPYNTMHHLRGGVTQGAGDGKLVVGNGMVIVDKDTYAERLF